MKRALGFMNKTAALDADAQAFITAAVLTDPTQISAINTLVVALKGYSLWTKFIAIYPIVGGTAFTHKWNLKDPRDLDAAFRLTYTGSITHSSNGIIIGVGKIADTNINPSLYLVSSSNHLSNYCRTTETGVYFDIGGGYTSADIYGLGNAIVGNLYSDNPSNASGRVTIANANPQGYFISTKTASNSHKAYKNGSALFNNTTNITTALGTRNIYLGRVNAGTPYESPRQYAFFSIGTGLTDTDASNLYTAIQAYQTTLGRQV